MIPNNACPLRITAAAGTELAGASSGGTVRKRRLFAAALSSRLTEVYDPKAFILHAALLRQAFAHCAIFRTAAHRSGLDRVSVPVWPIALSGRLPIAALVSRYLTNQLIGRGPLLERQLSRIGHLSSPDPRAWRAYAALARVSPSYSPLQGRLPTCYSPVRRSTRGPKAAFALDLHVSGTPPAFILSQDQTLQLNPACARRLAVRPRTPGAVSSALVASGNGCSRMAIADARPGGETATPGIGEVLCPCRTVISRRPPWPPRNRRGLFLYSVFKEPAVSWPRCLLGPSAATTPLRDLPASRAGQCPSRHRPRFR